MPREQKPFNQPTEEPTHRRNHQEERNNMKWHVLCAKVSSVNSVDMEENKPNFNNRQPIDSASSNSKSQDKNTKSSAVRGIQVTSRNNSQERKGLITSRSRERQKQSRQIKSQTHISQFEASQPKQSSTNTPSQLSLQDYCLLFQKKLSETVRKFNSSHEQELTQLKEIIQSNQERIDNLIHSLNLLLQKNQKKQRTIEKLQARLQSLYHYHEQCHEYGLTRCQNIQTIQRVLTDQLQQSSKLCQSHTSRLNTLDLLTKNVFLIQRYKNNQILQSSAQQIAKLNKMVEQTAQQLLHLEHMNRERQKYTQKEEELEQYLREFKNVLAGYRKTQHSSTNNNTNPQIGEITTAVNQLQQQIASLEQQQLNLIRTHQVKQESARQSIWELSNLLNKHERELQSKQQELDSCLSYSKDMQNKLIESKLKEHSLERSLQSHSKELKQSAHQQYQQLQKQFQNMQINYQQILQHNQHLELITHKHKLTLSQQEQEIAQLKATLSTQQQRLQQTQQLQNQLQLKQDYWSNRLKLQTDTFNSTLAKQQQQFQQQQLKQTQNSQQILLLQTEQQQLKALKAKLQSQHQQLQLQLTNLKKQLQDEISYSQHLEQENQQLNQHLEQYQQVFQNQSNVFKNTIEQLKQENNSLQLIVETQTDKMFANQPKKYTSNNNSNSSNSIAPSTHNSKINQLLKTFTQTGMTLPVLCEIDSSGYLKSKEEGTYIYDSQDNPFQLTPAQTQTAVNNRIISLFQ